MSLKEYNKKRDFSKTKEPSNNKENKSNKNLRFVVQHHLATNDHYDFRLEWHGTLKSFAIPKGPSFNPNDKRLAIKVEDHPLSYQNFEGTIPKGQYGGGIVMIWDEGTWESINNNDFDKGPIKFILNGKRLKGKWNLVLMHNNNWLLIKEKDSFSKKTAGISKFNTSIKSNLTMKEIKDLN